MAHQPPEQIPHASITAELLSDIAPELALRWCMQEASETDPSRQRSFPASLYRALISILLRAASSQEASAVYEVLTRALSLPLESPGACLGFSSTHESGYVAQVLTNLASAAARDEPLLQTGPALTLYATAGHGVGDPEEFHTATADHRADFADANELLQDVRSNSLAMAVELFALALEKDGQTAQNLKDAVLHYAHFLAPFTEVLPMSVDRLCPTLRQALARLYAAYMRRQTDAVRQDLRTRLASSFMRLAVDRPSNLGLYVLSVTDSEMRMSACRVSLIQRFGVRDKFENPFSLSLLMSTYLTITAKDGRANAAVPSLVSGLLMGWFELAEASDFRVAASGTNHDTEVAAKVKVLRKFLHRAASSFGASNRDVTTLKIAVMTIANRILESNSQV